MGQKMQFCFTNISAEILLHVLGYSFRSECHILAHFDQKLLPLNAPKIICAKSCNGFTPKMLMKLRDGLLDY
jgi:hypothetical protein